MHTVGRSFGDVEPLTPAEDTGRRVARSGE